MWTAQTAGSLDGKDDPDILFLDDKMRRYPATVPRHHGWDPLEIYLRRLGRPDVAIHRKPGWKVADHRRTRGGRPIPDDGKIHLLATTDPRNRHCLIEFQVPAPMSLLAQMEEQLFERI